MTTYTCKCGKTFEGRGDSVTTGYRIPRAEYTLEHDCFGCPFIREVNAAFLECRGTKNTLIYGTTASCVSSKASTLHVTSLDFNFIKDMQDYYNSLGVENPKDPPLPSMEDGSGRYPFSFDFPKNNTGEKAKRDLIDHFFEKVECEDSYREVYARKDVSDISEKCNLYGRIEKAKEEAKAMNKDQTFDVAGGTKYRNGNRILHVGPYQDKFRTLFCFVDDPTETFFGAIPASDTPEISQKMLDSYATKHGYGVYIEPLMSEQSSDEIPADAADEPESADAGEQEQGETPDSENDEPPEGEDPGDSADDTPDSDMQETHTGPCDWKNASGADEDEDEENDDQGEELSAEVIGNPPSLRGSELDAIVTTADSVLNGLIAMLHEKKQRDGEMTIKITFEEEGYNQFVFGGTVSGKINYTVKPQKIFVEPVELKFDIHGNPIVPADRQHQINFDELQPGRVIPPSSTVTVDGTTGIVEDYQETAEVSDTDLQEEDQEQILPPCDHEDCPFHGSADNGCTGCCFDSEDPDGVNFAGDVWTAVNMEFCQRPGVMEAYQKNNPEDDYDGSDLPDDFGDLPFEMAENNEEDFAS